MKKAALEIDESLLGKDEEELLRILDTKFRYQPTAAVEAMRNNFWMEHDRVSVTRNEIVNQSNIYLGVVSREYFYKLVSEHPHIIAYILCRPPEYEAVMKGLLNLSTRKIRDVLNLPLQKADGSLQDAKIIELVLKAAAMVDLRAKGGYIQRSETKNLTLMKQENSYTNVFTAAGSVKTTDLSTLTTDIDAKIAALEKEMQAIPGIQAAIEEQLPSQAIDASYTKVEDVDV
jgi:outer membrane murein-binding lipoprotein Lpp